AELVLGQQEGVVPETGLEVALDLRQVEVRAAPAVEKLPAVVEEVQREVEDARRHRLAVDEHVLLEEVPAAWAHDQRRRLVDEPVLLALRAGEVDGPADGVAPVPLALDGVLPRRGVRVAAG